MPRFEVYVTARVLSAARDVPEHLRVHESKSTSRPHDPSGLTRGVSLGGSTWTLIVHMGRHEDLRDRQERAARNQALFREVNERIEDANPLASGSVSARTTPALNGSPVTRLDMTSREYEHVRADGARFFVAPSPEHVWPDAERVTERHSNYWIVEKIEHSAEIAMHRDPRSDGPLRVST
jgi:hypothetical protein